MKGLIKAAAALLTIAGSLAMAQQPGGAKPAAESPQPTAHILTNPELDRLLANPEKLILIDVRRPDEVSANGGFPVYLSIQLNDLANSIAWIPKERTVVLVSNHAARASKAADILTARGFNVAGAVGAQTYEKAGGTLVHIAVPPPRPENSQKPAGGE